LEESPTDSSSKLPDPFACGDVEESSLASLESQELSPNFSNTIQ
jgi:hypothetical protein